MIKDAKPISEIKAEWETFVGELLGSAPKVPPVSADQKAESIDELIKGWEAKLATAGDDAQLANIDLQSQLQRQQQTLQLMSSASKILHDSAMDVIRKIG